VDLDRVSLRVALRSVASRAGLQLMWSEDIADFRVPVHLAATGITVAAALTDLLAETGLDVVFNRSGSAVLMRRERVPLPLVGSIRGRIMDDEAHPIPSAQLVVEGTAARATTDAAGEYRIGSIAAGEHRVTARRIGYAPLTKPVSVGDA